MDNLFQEELSIGVWITADICGKYISNKNCALYGINKNSVKIIRDNSLVAKDLKNLSKSN